MQKIGCAPRIAAVFLFASLTACGGGGGGGTSVVPVPVATLTPGGPTQAILTIVVPSVGPSARRHPKFVPGSAAAIGGTVNGTAITNLNFTCGSTPVLTCAAAFNVPPGNDTFDLVLYGNSKKALSHATLTQNMPTGAQTQIHPTFRGIVASATLAADVPYPLVGSPKTINLSITASDADGNVITGDPFDTPVTLSLGATNTHVALPVNAIFNSPTDKVAVSYDGRNAASAASFDLGSNGSVGTSTPFYPDSFQSYGPISSFVGGVSVGSGGTVWFIGCAQGNGGPCHPGSITNGIISEFAALPGMGYNAAGTLGPDGNMWFTAGNPFPTGSTAYVYRVTPSGTETSIPLHPLGANQGYEVYAITSGPDGNIWVAEADRIDSVSMSGTVNSYPLDWFNRPRTIVTGPDGRLWFDDWSKIGAITTSGTITYYPLQSGVGNLSSDVTFGNDGNLYFIAGAPFATLEKMTTAGVDSTVVTNEQGFGTSNIALTKGKDGNLWGTASVGYTTFLPVASASLTAALTTQIIGGQPTYYYGTPIDNAQMIYRVVPAPDGSLWSGFNNYVTRFIYNP